MGDLTRRQENDSNEGIASSLISSLIKNGGVSDAASEISEIGLDSIIDNEVINVIPVVKII